MAIFRNPKGSCPTPEWERWPKATVHSPKQQPKAARLLMTGWTEAVANGELEALGIQGPLSKPWDDAALKESLRKALAVVASNRTA